MIKKKLFHALPSFGKHNGFLCIGNALSDIIDKIIDSLIK